MAPPNVPEPSCELAQLLQIIQSAGATILNTYQAHSVQFPSLNKPYNPGDVNPELTSDPQLCNAIDLVVAAAGQLIAAVRDPKLTLWSTAMSWTVNASFKTATDLHIPEILQEAEPNGLHVNEIAAKAAVNPNKLGRILRLLATNHVFREVEPDVFANNKLSSLLSTSKPHSEIVANPNSKHDGTNGYPALLSVNMSFGLNVAPHVYANLTDPRTAFSEEQDDSTFKRAYGHTMFDYLNLNSNTVGKEFGIAMTGLNAIKNPQAVLKGFDWSGLPAGSEIIDVGGGVGGLDLEILKLWPTLKCIVQDQPQVISSGEKWFRERLPNALDNGSMKFQAHDFFAPQPPRDRPPSVFLLRSILHDWSQRYSTTILSHLRDAAGPETRLLIVDLVLTTSCPDNSGGLDDIKNNLTKESNLQASEPPKPLLFNLGKTHLYSGDISMMNLLNAQERTLREFKDVLRMAGWKLTHLHYSDTSGSQTPLLIAKPTDR
ncbi:S-adenosyl-L-methionine-dependent methyltransferase [Ramaria rubella]|nr:S-adenosyl-L-methionine-dependent methyltransferase [Ramaria rubella]